MKADTEVNEKTIGEIIDESKDIEQSVGKIISDGVKKIVNQFSFILKRPHLFFLAVTIIAITPLQGFFLQGINDGIWQFVDLITSLFSALIGISFYFAVKFTDQEYRKEIEKRDELIEKIREDHKNEVRNLIEGNTKEMSGLHIENNRLFIENHQLQMALELKKQAYELLKEERKILNMKTGANEL